MKHSWSEFFQECDSVANVTIVCRDGLIKTHKLILANISKFTENLMKDVPAADDVTIYLRQFTTLDVNLFLREPDSDPNLSTLFGVQHSINSNLKHEVNDENLSSIICKEEHFEEGEDLESTESKSVDIDTTKLIKRRKRRDKNEIEAIRVKYDQAINAFKSGRFSSISKAAKKYGVAASTLRDLIKANKSFEGRGRKSVYLSRKEEQAIVHRARELSNGGKDLTTDMFKNIIVEEVQALIQKFPERYTALSSLEIKMKQTPPCYHLYNMAKRHKVKLKSELFVRSQNTSKESKIEKEMCESTDDASREDLKCEGDGAEKVKFEETQHDNVGKEKVDDSDDDDMFNQETEEYLDVEEYDRNVAEKIRELEDDFISEPLTKKDRTFNATIERKIRLQRAMADLKTGRLNSYSKAGQKHQIAPSTLRDFCVEKHRKGRLKYLTEEEERHIKTRLLILSNNGKDLTLDLVRKIFTEEFEILKINFPERKNLEELQQNPKLYLACIVNFSNRHRLSRLCDRQLKQDREERRIFECEICQDSFTFKNALVSHQRRAHSFMYS